MLFDPAALLSDWPLMLATLGIIIVVKPLAALLMTTLFRKPLRLSLSVAVALGQIGEFSFILAAMGILSTEYPQTALRIMKKELVKDGNH